VAATIDRTLTIIEIGASLAQSCVVPAKAGSSGVRKKSHWISRFRGNDDIWIGTSASILTLNGLHKARAKMLFLQRLQVWLRS
jgi:hypothetical protein